MKNSVKCPNCNFDNAFFNFVCTNCHVYLRDRVYNLDLWSTISSLIDTPSKAFKTIIFSEHKNFVYFILLFVTVKLLINVRFVSMLSLGDFRTTVGLQYSYLMVLGGVLIFFLLFSYLFKEVGKINGFFLRFKDTFAIIIYSQMPYLFGLIILFSLELVLFGDYLFSRNPSPFLIKGNLAYLFLLLEVAVIIWNIVLVFKAFNIQTNQKSFSFYLSVTFVVLFWILIYALSLFIFTI